MATRWRETAYERRRRRFAKPKGRLSASIDTRTLQQIIGAVDHINKHVDGMTTTLSREVEIALRKHIAKLQRDYNRGRVFLEPSSDLPAGRPRKDASHGTEDLDELICEEKQQVEK